MVKREWTFMEPKTADADVTCGVAITGAEQKTIKVTLFNSSDIAVEDPLIVEILREGEVVETLENHTPTAISPNASTTKEYNYTPEANGWLVKVTYGED